jgi:serine/threonine protein kinase
VIPKQAQPKNLFNTNTTFAKNMPAIIDRYQPEAVIGTGTYGSVLRCIDLTNGRRVAVKVAHQQPAFRKAAVTEVRLLKGLIEGQCPASTKMLNFFEDNNRIHIVFELLESNLYENMVKRRFERAPLSLVRDVAQTVLTSLSNVHKLGYMHCDVKPENVMTRRNAQTGASEIVMIDFGSVRPIAENQYYDIQSLWYRAPEVTCGLPYTTAIDAWSVGCLLFEVHTGVALFPGQDPQSLMSHICAVVGAPSANARANGKLAGGLHFNPTPERSGDVLKTQIRGDAEHGEAVGDSLRHLITRLLDPDEATRLTVAEALRHPFMALQAMQPCEPAGVDIAQVEMYAAEMGNNSCLSSTTQLSMTSCFAGHSPTNSNSSISPAASTDTMHVPGVATAEWEIL